MQGLGLLSLRCVVGLVSIAHGLPKVFPMGNGVPQDVAAVFETAGINPAMPVTVATGLAEILGRALLTAGAYTFWTGLLLVATNLAVAWKLHVPHGFFINWSLEPGVGHGYEFVLVLRVFHDVLAAAYPQCRMQLRHWVGVKCERHAPRRGQSVSIDRQRALRTMALSLAKHSSMGLKSGL